MILLYTSLVLALAGFGWLLRRRAAVLERKYARLARSVNGLAHESSFRPGNRQFDACQLAKRQYQLGLLVQKRDRVEGRYHAWAGAGDRVSKLTNRLRQWKGKKLPYTFGVLDVSGVLYAVDYFGVSHYVSAPQLWHWLTTLAGN